MRKSKVWGVDKDGILVKTLHLVDAEILVVDNDTKVVLTEGKDYTLVRNKKEDMINIRNIIDHNNISVYAIAKKIL